MTKEVRLVVQRRVSHWGGDIPLERVWYYLQWRDNQQALAPAWHTIPVVSFDSLTKEEQDAIEAVMAEAR